MSAEKKIMKLYKGVVTDAEASVIANALVEYFIVFGTEDTKQQNNSQVSIVSDTSINNNISTIHI